MEINEFDSLYASCSLSASATGLKKMIQTIISDLHIWFFDSCEHEG